MTLAREELAAAELLLRSGHARVAIARMYFAVFHTARARLFASGLEPKTHAGVQHLFNVHFVRPGTYAPEHSQLLARLQKYREEADYAAAFAVDEAGAARELEAARAFLDRVRAELATAPPA